MIGESKKQRRIEKCLPFQRRVFGRFLVLAPLLDLPGFIDPRQGPGVLGRQPSVLNGERDDQRSGE